MGTRSYYTYIMASRSRVLSVGMTNNLARRVREHRRQEADGFTAQYNVTRLVWYRPFSRARDAIAAEKRIKGWTRDKKIALIDRDNPDWTDHGPDVMASGEHGFS